MSTPGPEPPPVRADVSGGHAAWHARMGLAHLVALAIVLAGLALAADEVMPRIGYSPIDVTWRCPG